MKKYISLLFAVALGTSFATAQIDRSKMPVAGPAPTINLSAPQTFTAKNGMKVMVVENHKLPRVSVQLLLDNPMHAAGNKAGVEGMFSAMMGNGTTSISKDAFNEEVDFLGANISFGSESAFASSLSKYFPRIMELMGDAVINPLLTEAEFKSEKDKALEGLKNQEKNVSAIASQVTAALAYGKKHPKGEFTTIESVEGLTLADVKSYYEKYFSPQNAYLVVIGDTDMKEVKKLVNKHLSDWKSSTVPAITYTDPVDVQYTQINFIDMENAVQSELTVQNLVNLKISDPDYHAVLIANKILGGGFNSMLNMNLREANGWTYGARSNTGAGKEITRFTASTSVRNAVTDSAVVETLKEINNIRTVKVTTQQLANAKSKYKGDFILALERPQTVANYALRIETQDLDKNFYKDYLKKIDAVTADDVMRVANKYYKPDNLRIVVVGKGSEVLEALKTVNGPNGKVVPVMYFDKYGEKTTEPEFNKALPAGVSTENVLAKYIDAIGGKAAAQKVNSVAMMADAEVQGMKLGLEMKNTTKGQSSVEVSMMGSVMQKVKFDGQKGYMEAQGQRMDNTDEMNKDAMANAGIFAELTPSKAKLKGIESIDGKDAYKVSYGDKKESFYDVATGLKVKEVSQVEAAGQVTKSIINYSNYKAVDGVKFPHTIVQFVGPQELKFEINKIMINSGVSDADFK